MLFLPIVRLYWFGMQQGNCREISVKNADTVYELAFWVLSQQSERF